jgi:hypothetical protein
MKKEDLRDYAIRSTQSVLDRSGLLVLSHADQEIIRALNRLLLKEDEVVQKWFDELPADMRETTDASVDKRERSPAR